MSNELGQRWFLSRVRTMIDSVNFDSKVKTGDCQIVFPCKDLLFEGGESRYSA